MNRLFISLIAVFTIVGGLVVFQATRQTARAVLLPSELKREANPRKLMRVRVGGRVAELLNYNLEPRIELSFTVKDPESDEQVAPQKNDGDEAIQKEELIAVPVTVPVVYNGLKPDMFAPGRDVIIEGEFVNGTLVAHSLLTQCPSKYEPPTPGHGGGAE